MGASLITYQQLLNWGMVWETLTIKVKCAWPDTDSPFTRSDLATRRWIHYKGKLAFSVNQVTLVCGDIVPQLWMVCQ